MGLPMTAEETAAEGVVPLRCRGLAAAQRSGANRCDVPFGRQLGDRVPRAGGLSRSVGHPYTAMRVAPLIEFMRPVVIGGARRTRRHSSVEPPWASARGWGA